jgi:hypothetical protein
LALWRVKGSDRRKWIPVMPVSRRATGPHGRFYDYDCAAIAMTIDLENGQDVANGAHIS